MNIVAMDYKPNLMCAVQTLRVKITLPMPGRHNVLNALAVIALADHLGVNDNSLVAALSNFQGVDRRFQLAGFVYKKGRQIPVIDDYGHHQKNFRLPLMLCVLHTLIGVL